MKLLFLYEFFKRNMCEIVVHNEGPVPLEIRERFFDKYVTHGKKNGTGLGTYSAKLITTTLHGFIAMESSDEAGTNITVRLPLYHAS